MIKNGRSLLPFLLSTVSFLLSCHSQKMAQEKVTQKQDDQAMLYFGQTPPTKIPELFAPEIISKPGRYEFGCTMSADGKEFYYGVDNNGQMEIYFTELKNGAWTSDQNLFPNDSCSYNDPMLSPDEQKLFFISNRPKTADGIMDDIDIWYIQRTDKGWSSPFNVGDPINDNLDQYYMSFTNDGTMFYASKDKTPDAPKYAFDIYKAAPDGNKFLTPQKLPEEINTNRYEADVFIAPDESYMIFCSIRRSGYGIGDLYISFRDDSGKWSPAVNMGPTLNTDQHELCPFVTKDGKYFFYTSNKDIYWVSADIINDYKQ